MFSEQEKHEEEEQAEMSQHSERDRFGPSRLSVGVGWGLAAVVLVGTAYIGWGLATWREVAGFGLGIFSTVMVLAQVVSMMMDRSDARYRADRELGRQRARQQRIQELAEQHEDDQTQRLLGRPMKAGGPLERSPQGVKDQLRVVPVFASEIQRAEWMDAQTEIMESVGRIRASGAVRHHHRLGGPGQGSPQGPLSTGETC